MKRYILADDLTGALEIGASFRQGGHDAVVELSGAGSSAPGQLEIATSESRNLRPSIAAQRVRDILRHHEATGTTLLFKKIDSTLRGPVAAELAATIEVLRPPLTILCPANPVTGRTVVDGTLWVHGVRLAETDFGRDPQFPVRESHLPTLLSAEFPKLSLLTLTELRGSYATGIVRAARHEGNAVLISDAETAEDLMCLATVAREACAQTLFVGANGLGRALAALQRKSAGSPARPRETLRTLLIVCGSRHPASHRQIERIADRSDVATVSLQPGRSTDEGVAAVRQAFGQASVVAVRFSRDAPITPAAVLEQLAAIVAGVPRPDGFFFTGGETAFAAIRALRGERLRITDVWEDVVVRSEVEGLSGSPLSIFTKPGGYGDDALLQRLLAHLMA